MSGSLSPAGRKLLDTDPFPPIVLVRGDLVLAEPAARGLAEELARRAGVEVQRHRRPQGLEGVLGDLRTFALFGGGKVALVLDSAIFSDRKAAADLVDQAGEALPLSEGPELAPGEREAASRLVQALHVFGLDQKEREPAELLDELPKWALQGGAAVRKRKPRGRSAKDVQELKAGLVELMARAQAAGVVGFPEGDLAVLEDAVRQGLPEGHHLILAERSAAKDHPLVQRLVAAEAVIDLATVEAGRRGELQGVAELARGLREETGVSIEPRALDELVRRTIKQDGKDVSTDSTARLAGEYRKLAHQVGTGGTIRVGNVEGTVQDRGDEDVWKVLDAIGEGRGGEALARLRRLLATAENHDGELLRFFGLVASFCRQLTTVAGLVRERGLPTGERNYRRFEKDLAPRLQGELPGGRKSPVGGLHPFRLFRSYRAAVGLSPRAAASLPWWLLETEMRIKGDASDGALALETLVARLASQESSDRGRR